jgi:hypothetical protein
LHSQGFNHEDSFLPYRETTLQTAEAVAALAVYRFLRQAYWAYRDDRLSFEQAVERLERRVRQLAPLAIHEESLPVTESFINPHGHYQPGGGASSEALFLHDRAVERLAAFGGYPDLLQPLLAHEEPGSLVEAARAIQRADTRLREWAESAPGTEQPENPVSPDFTTRILKDLGMGANAGWEVPEAPPDEGHGGDGDEHEMRDAPSWIPIGTSSKEEEQA